MTWRFHLCFAYWHIINLEIPGLYRSTGRFWRNMEVVRAVIIELTGANDTGVGNPTKYGRE